MGSRNALDQIKKQQSCLWMLRMDFNNLTEIVIPAFWAQKWNWLRHAALYTPELPMLMSKALQPKQRVKLGLQWASGKDEP